MKRVISILLAMVIVLSLCACGGSKSTAPGGGSEKTQEQTGSAGDKQEAAEPAAESAEPEAEAEAPAAEAEGTAAETAQTPDNAGEKKDYTDTYKKFGMTVHYPEEFASTTGVLYPREGSEFEPGINALAYYYAAMPKDTFDTVMNSDDPEAARIIGERMCELVYVFYINKGRGASELISAFPDLELKEEQFTQIGKVDDLTYYLFDAPELLYRFTSDIEPEYTEEYHKLHDALIEVLKNAEFFAPIIPGGRLVGETLKFETTDVDGNPVKSEEIFAQNKITMVNIWATWCGNCVGELAGLAEMNHRLADKNVAVIGICNDADTEPDKCKALIEENGVDYLNLMPVDDLDKMLEIPGLPTSYFVDSEGKILCAPFIGAPMEMVAYEKVIDSLLADEEVVVERGMPVAPNSEGVYRVIVTDSDGDFVPGVRVQFCSDSFCMMGKTDENGVAVFKADEGTVYTAHIMKFPDGYVPNADEYKTTDTYCDICIVLQKQ